MKFTSTFALAFILALAKNALAAENSTTEDQVGTSKGVKFPFSDDAILEAVSLGEDIAPIVLDDAVYFINTTIADSDMSKLSKRDAEAWRFGSFDLSNPCTPLYKRTEGAPVVNQEECDKIRKGSSSA